MPIIALVLLVAAALGGGVSAIAQHALPGEPLYDFKVRINERVETALSIGDEARANLSLALAEARLDEARRLATENKLTAQMQADISTSFEARAKAVADAVARLQEAGRDETAADIAARFQSMLAAHSSSFAQADANATAEIRTVLSPIITQVRTMLGVASNLSAEASARPAARSAR